MQQNGIRDLSRLRSQIWVEYVMMGRCGIWGTINRLCLASSEAVLR